jgi:hypothetical protein
MERTICRRSVSVFRTGSAGKAFYGLLAGVGLSCEHRGREETTRGLLPRAVVARRAPVCGDLGNTHPEPSG